MSQSCPTVACQALLSMGLPRQEYSSGLPLLPKGDLPNPEIKPTSPALAGRLFTTAPPGTPHAYVHLITTQNKIQKQITAIQPAPFCTILNFLVTTIWTSP